MSEDKDLMDQENREIENKISVASSVQQQLATDIIESDKELCLYIDMPGVAKEHVELKLEKNILAVKGVIDSQYYENTKPLYSEYKVNDFFRQFELSNEIDQEKIKANVKDGVLTVILPKIPEKPPKMIQVN